MKPVIAIHGGAGTARGGPRHRAALLRALKAGYGVLRDEGSSLDAVVAAVVVLEDSPLFNAGKGAAYNAEGKHELDAAVMDGAMLRAGAVACVRTIRNPVLAARAVMERSEHVMLAAAGAERFARRHGLAMAPQSYFHTRDRLAALKARLKEDVGTVGAVALDAHGRLAAATSTGGVTGKLPGRIGDSPIVGAGVYADEVCAVSGTGHGEFFIRAVLAHDVAARMRYLGESVRSAAAGALARLTRLGSSGGLIAVDSRGNIAMPFTTESMYRGAIGRDARVVVVVR